MDFLEPYLWYDFTRLVINWPHITGLTIDRIHPDKLPMIQKGDALLNYKGDISTFSKN